MVEAIALFLFLFESEIKTPLKMSTLVLCTFVNVLTYLMLISVEM